MSSSSGRDRASTSVSGKIECPCCRAELIVGIVLAAKHLPPPPEHEDAVGTPAVELVKKEEEPLDETQACGKERYPPPCL